MGTSPKIALTSCDSPTSIRWNTDWRSLPQSITAYDFEELGVATRLDSYPSSFLDSAKL